ncbi:GH1 family beta-glucosidase [Amycolatopsis sp. cmx-4-68]|uniref:GH1 family beta-glucosidase n=1 Tax=Amycolatopsis sp. cmx-4-68 TaxID=2790938 RepID=UPI00397B517E
MESDATAFAESPAFTAALATLPSAFRWGVATSAYQIEGAVDSDGRGQSVWDTFCRKPGAIVDGSNGDIACDHYHRMPADVRVIAGLGVDTYRFSISWPRVQPSGRGPANPAGLGFYDRLVDELLAAGIDPWVTLYHWDLPQELEDLGGWPARDTAYRFADFAMLVFDRLGDRAPTVTTLNEPWVVARLGYREGRHAPGRKDLQDSISAGHHLLLGHGLAVRAMRSVARRPVDFGVTLNMSTSTPASAAEVDQVAARLADGMGLRIYMDPLHHGSYPQDVIDLLALDGVEIPVRDDDLAVISTPLDLLGLNYYFGQYFSGHDENGTAATDRPVFRQVPPPDDLARTAMGWPIMPDGLATLLLRIARDYPGLPVVITENGGGFPDPADANGFVEDHDRVDFMARHIAAMADARQRGADVRGYFAWSLLDNFEWAAGYRPRFGLVHVDYETLERVPKRSALWFRDTISRVREGIPAAP